MPARLPAIRWLCVLTVAAMLTVPIRAAEDWASESALADIVVSFDDAIRVYGNADGLQKGPDIPVPGSNRGIAFDGSLTLFVTNTAGGVHRVVRRSPDDPHEGTGTSPTQDDPEAIVFAGNGDYFVGSRVSTSPAQAVIRRYDRNGTLLSQFTVTVDGGGTCLGIDLDPNQQTLYVVDGATHPAPRLIRTLNVANGSQGSLPQSLTGSSRSACGIRVLPPESGTNLTNGGFLVADRIDIRRLGATGAQVGTGFTTGSPSPSDNNWIDVDLDPNTFTFWGLDAGELRVARFRLASPPDALQSISNLPGVPRGFTLNGALRAAETIRLLTLTSNVLSRVNPAFLKGTSYEHEFQVKPETDEPVAAFLAVQAVEARSDGNPAGEIADGSGICPASLDLDCRLREHFPHPLQAGLSAAVARGYSRQRGVFYMVSELQPGCSATTTTGCLPPDVVLRLGAIYPGGSPGGGAACVPNGPTSTAVALLRDPKPHTAASQVGYSVFEEDITVLVSSAFGRTLNHYVVADRSDTLYSALMVKPSTGTNQQLGSTMQVAVEIRDPSAGCNPVPALNDTLALSITELATRTLIVDTEGISDGPMTSGLEFVANASQYRVNVTLTAPPFVANTTPPGVPSHRVCVNSKADPVNPTAPRAIGEVCRDFRVVGKEKK